MGAEGDSCVCGIRRECAGVYGRGVLLLIASYPLNHKYAMAIHKMSVCI